MRRAKGEELAWKPGQDSRRGGILKAWADVSEARRAKVKDEKEPELKAVAHVQEGRAEQVVPAITITDRVAGHETASTSDRVAGHKQEHGQAKGNGTR